MSNWNQVTMRSPLVWIVIVASLGAGVVTVGPIIASRPSGAQLQAAEKLQAMGVALERDEHGNVKNVRINPGTSLECLAYLEPLPQLRSLGFPSTDATDADLVHLQRLSSLEELIISGNEGITDSGLKNLEGLVNLRLLYLTAVPTNGSGLAHLSRLKKLEELNLAYAKLKSENMAHLAAFSSLKALDVSYTDFSDDSLEHLRGLKGLKFLGVMAAKVTPEAGDQLKTEMPDLTIRFGL